MNTRPIETPTYHAYAPNRRGQGVVHVDHHSDRVDDSVRPVTPSPSSPFSPRQPGAQTPSPSRVHTASANVPIAG